MKKSKSDEYTLTWGMYDGEFCFFVNGETVIRCTSYDKASLLRELSKSFVTHS